MLHIHLFHAMIFYVRDSIQHRETSRRNACSNIVVQILCLDAEIETATKRKLE